VDFRLRGLPPALWRQVRDKAGDRLQAVLLGLLRAYVDGTIDPLSDGDPVAAAMGAKGGRARGASLDAATLSAQGRTAAAARWKAPR
jgi:hypothetical protein